MGKACLKLRKHGRCRRFLSGTPRRELLRKAGQLRRTPVVDLFSKACKSWASVAQTFRTVSLHCRIAAVTVPPSLLPPRRPSSTLGVLTWWDRGQRVQFRVLEDLRDAATGFLHTSDVDPPALPPTNDTACVAMSTPSALAHVVRCLGWRASHSGVSFVGSHSRHGCGSDAKGQRNSHHGGSWGFPFRAERANTPIPALVSIFKEPGAGADHGEERWWNGLGGGTVWWHFFCGTFSHKDVHHSS